MQPVQQEQKKKNQNKPLPEQNKLQCVKTSLLLEKVTLLAQATQLYVRI